MAEWFPVAMPVARVRKGAMFACLLGAHATPPYVYAQEQLDGEPGSEMPAADSSLLQPHAGSPSFVEMLLTRRLDAPPNTGSKIGLKLSLGAGISHSTNAYGNSNIALGTRIPAQGDQIVDFSVSGIAYVDLSERDRVSVSGNVGRNFFLKKNDLSHNSAGVSFGIYTMRLKPFQLGAGYSCAREFDSGLLYKNCGPDVSARSVVRLSKTADLHVDAAGFYRRGRDLYFEDYYGGKLSTIIATSGQTSLYGGIQYTFRHFDGGYGKFLGFSERRDHRISVPIGVEHAIGNRVFVGFAASGSVNWSNYDEYRYWDVTFGPRLRIEVF
jgi:hypothetical protein